MRHTKSTNRFFIFILFVAMSVPQFAVSATITTSANVSAKFDSYKRVTVTTRGKKYTVDRIIINLNNPKLTVKTLAATSKTNCYNQTCRLKPLASFVSEAKGFAAIHGTYSCPADYVQCQGQVGAFYRLVFNARTRAFVNERQNQFNNGPLFVIGANKMWELFRDTKLFPGKDAWEDANGTTITGAINESPLLVYNKNVVVNRAELDAKQATALSARGALGIRGRQLFLVVVHGATVVDSAYVMKALGVDRAMNLDGGGSTAMWYRGTYKLGPGRPLPNAIVFTER